MATRKQLLDQNDNEILPITDTESVRNPQSIGGTLESRLATVENTANGAIKGVQQNGVDLQKDEYGKVNVTVQDGKSALQIYNETYGTNLNEAQFIDALKQNYPMEYVAYNQTAAEQPIGTGFSAIDTLTADSTTAGKMYLMPNNGTTPTGTILFVTVQTGVSTYAWYKLGDLDVPSNVLTEDDETFILIDEHTENVPTYTIGKKINNNGIFNDANSVMTDFVKVTPGIELTVNFGNQGVENGAIMVYNESKVKINWYSVTLPNRTLTTAQMSNVYYIRTDFVLSLIDNCSIVQNGVDVWDKEKKQLKDFLLYTQQSLTDAQKQQARTNIGAISEADIQPLEENIEQVASDVQEIDSKTSVLNHESTTSIKEEVVITDDSDNPIVGVDSNGFFVGEHVRLPLLSKNADRTLKEYSDDENPIKLIKESMGLAALFENWGFIGDSLTSGFITVPDVGGEAVLKDTAQTIGRNIYPMSWGQIICKLCGSKGANYSFGGATTRTWLSAYAGKTTYSLGYSDGTTGANFGDKRDAYTIMLGTNDYNNSIPVGNVDTDVDLNDYNNNADTFAGNYAKIIQMCKEMTPSCKIFCITPYKDWIGVNADGTYNNVVRQLVSKFSKVYLIDLYTYGGNLGADYLYNGHGTSQGYTYVAYVIANYIDYIVRNNPQDFIFQGCVSRLKDGKDNGNY